MRNTSPTCRTTAVLRTTPETRSRADGSGLVIDAYIVERLQLAVE